MDGLSLGELRETLIDELGHFGGHGPNHSQRGGALGHISNVYMGFRGLWRCGFNPIAIATKF